MARKISRPYARYTHEALRLLSQQIKLARLERRITAQELSERAGVSRGLLRRIESGDPACSIGVVFEVAVLLGVPLFAQDITELQGVNSQLQDTIMLLPARVVKDIPELDDDF